MTMRRKPYNFRERRRADQYVRNHFRDMKGPLAHCYFLGLPHLEQITEAGFAGWICASFERWAKASFHTEKTVKKAIEGLQSMGLIDFKRGEWKQRLATKVRRRTLNEIKNMVPRERLNKYVPVDAEALAERLESIGVDWGGEHLTPRYTAKRTGRIYMNTPNLQNKPEQKRIAKLAASLLPGETLVCCDYSQGEPSVLLHSLRENSLWPYIKNPADIYNDLSSALGIPRQEAKGKLLKLFYSRRRTVTVPLEWNLPADSYLRKLPEAVNEYRNRLWETGKPRGGKPRFTSTVLGRTIPAEPRDRVHRGKILSWRIQGSLADIFNDALKEILNAHERGEMRFLMQVFDSVYVTVKQGEEQRVPDIMEQAAVKAGIEISTQTSVHHRRKAMTG